MKTSEEKKLVAYLLHLTAVRLMARSPLQDMAQKKAAAIYDRLRAELEPDALALIDTMARTMGSLAEKLARCESPEALEQAHAFAQALLDGEVMIAQDNTLTAA